MCFQQHLARIFLVICWSSGITFWWMLLEQRGWQWASTGADPPEWQQDTSHRVEIEITDSYKYLCVHLSNQLDWTHNWDALYRKQTTCWGGWGILKFRWHFLGCSLTLWCHQSLSMMQYVGAAAYLRGRGYTSFSGKAALFPALSTQCKWWETEGLWPTLPWWTSKQPTSCKL